MFSLRCPVGGRVSSFSNSYSRLNILSLFLLSLVLGVHQAACVSSLSLLMTVLHQAPRRDSAIFRLVLKATRELRLLPFAANSPYPQFNLTFLFLLTINKFHYNITLPRLPKISLPPLDLLCQFMTFPWVFFASHTPKIQASLMQVSDSFGMKMILWFRVNAKSVSESFGIQSVWMRDGIIRTECVVARNHSDWTGNSAVSFRITLRS